MLRFVFALVCVPALATGAAASGIHPDWRDVARSQIILVGEPELSRGEFRQKLSSKPASYIAVPVRIVQLIKGEWDSRSLSFRVHTTDAENIEALRNVYKSATGRLIAGLVTNSGGNAQFHYFVEHQWRAPSKEEALSVLQGLRQEVARQDHIRENWNPDPTLPHFTEVKQLIDRMTDPELQEQAFRELEALGEAGAPAIIHQMDDRRPLAYEAISLENKSPHAFEAVRHYGPELIVDALAAILNQVTGESFGTIHNGASDFERDHTVAGWRIYDATVRGLPTPEDG